MLKTLKMALKHTGMTLIAFWQETNDLCWPTDTKHISLTVFGGKHQQSLTA